MKNKPMPEWLEDASYLALPDKYNTTQRPAERDIWYEGFEKCYELMSNRQGWQPIETCPKDEEVFVQTSKGVFAAYNDSEYGWCSLSNGVKPFFFKKFNPKIWMPIPEVVE